MLRVNDEYLDFNDLIEIERQSKLFEEISETTGDFSYQFTIPNTSNNSRILGFPLPDVKNKPIYQNVECDVIDESGIAIYKGLLKVERVDRRNNLIECSFFSGNYNWISLLTGPVNEIDFSDLDTDLTDAGISGTWTNTEGLIFPLIDSGTLITRSSGKLVVEDFTGMIFMKTVFKRIFNSVGVKVTGDLMTDPVFNSMLLSRLTLDETSTGDRSTYVAKNANQVINVISNTGPATSKVVFQDETSYPFYDGSTDNYSVVLSRYTADVKMRVDAEAIIEYNEQNVGVGIGTDVRTIRYKIFLNGVEDLSVQGLTGNGNTSTLKKEYLLLAGDYLEIFAFYEVTVTGAPSLGTLTMLPGSTFKVTPIFIYRTFGKSLVPTWTKSQLVSNVLSIFCAVCDFEPVSKTLTIDLFEKIKSKEPVDISEHSTLVSDDYSDFISSFFQSNLLKYEDSDLDEVKEYNIRYFEPYGAGTIEVDNAYIEKTGNILESEFKSPVSYLNTAFAASLERTSFYTLESTNDQSFDTVTDNAGSVQLNIPDDTVYKIGDLVRIENSTIQGYNGDWRVLATGVGSGYIVIDDLPYVGTAEGDVSRMRHEVNNDDGVYIFINTKYSATKVADFSKRQYYWIDLTPHYDMGYAFFNMLATGEPINEDYKQGLSFGRLNDPLSYQKTLIDTYWPQVGKVLNDPVKLELEATLPKIIYNELTPLRPVRFSSSETNNLYYLNRISGYKGSEYNSTIELIKLS